MHPDAKRRRYALAQGMIDAVMELPETAKAFKCSDEQLGVSRRAHELKVADALRSSAPYAPLNLTAISRRKEAAQAFESVTAGRGLWDSGLLAAAADHLRAVGYREPFELAFGVVDRFLRVMARAGGWLLPESSEPTFAPPIGRLIVIPAHWSAEDARERLQPVRDAEQARRGRPAAADAAAWRRDGRWHFLRQTGRATRGEWALTLHRNLGDVHAVRQGQAINGLDVSCDACLDEVDRRRKRILALLALKDNLPTLASPSR